MERRAYATFGKFWPNVEALVTSPQGGFEEYLKMTGLDREFVINAMMGDLQRIRLYAQRGFQIPQIIPKVVDGAFERLAAEGYDKQLISV